MALSNKWKINGQTLVSLAISNVSLAYENQQPDELSWMDPLTDFDADVRWAYDAEIVLTFDGVTRFRGRVRNNPRNLTANSEDINYRALGPWAWLDEMPYLQSYKVTAGGAVESRGDVILSMDGNGARKLLGQSVREVLESAIAAGCPISIGTIEDLDYEVPYDKTSDLSHADALSRLLQAAPTHVAFWDYTGLVPSFNCAPRGELQAVTLAVGSKGWTADQPYAPLEGIKLNALYQLQASCVCIIFRREDVENGVPSVKTFRQITPEGALPTQPRALTRTWELAGSVFASSSNYLRQPVRTQFISPALVGEGPILPEGETAAQFNTMVNFWKRKLPALRQVGVEILGFRFATRELAEPAITVNADGTETTSNEIDAACERELTAGAVTEWMQIKKNIKAQYHKLVVECRYKAFTADSTVGSPKKEIKHQIFTAIVTATSAQTRTYSFLESTEESFTPAEEPPPDMTGRLYAALSELQHDGTFPLYDPAFSYDIRPGWVTNLDTPKRPEWATMNALVQSTRVDIDAGRVEVAVGYAHQLGIDDMKDQWRSSKTREPVTTTRNYNSGGGGQAVGLAIYNPRNDATAVDAPPVQGTAEPVTPAGAVATSAEMIVKIKKYYTDLNILPVGGHWINIPITGRGAFRAYIHTANSNLGGQWNASFTMGEPAQTYWITLQQLGIY